MSDNFSNVESALIQAFNAGNFFDSDHTANENVKFTPPNADPWCAQWFVPSQQPLVATLGDEGRDRIEGFLQVDLNYPANIGKGSALAKFDLIRKLFTAGKRFAYNGNEVIIRTCGRSQGRIVNGCFKIVVTIYFYSDIQR